VNSTVRAIKWVTIFEDWINEAQVFHDNKVELKDVVTFNELEYNKEYNNNQEILKQIDEKEEENIQNILKVVDNVEYDDKCLEEDKIVKDKETILLLNEITIQKESCVNLDIDISNNTTGQGSEYTVKQFN
jgi:hypothetical protein